MKGSIKVHPTITNNKASKDTDQIAICCKLICKESVYNAVPKESGTLKDLYSCLEELFTKEKEDTNGQIIFELDNDVGNFIYHSLDELIEKHIILSKYKKVVICCPLHYFEFNSSQLDTDKIIALASEFTKLIYKIDIEDRAKHPQLQKFYDDYFDSERQKSKKVQIYDNIVSVAVQWFKHIRKIFMVNVEPQTRNNLTNQETY
ncbi:hypothetical protein H8E77_20345 [bacterium]|nr:hypothetical protein [bacterium]